MNKQNNAPLFHIVKRGALPWYQAWGIRAAAIVLALLFCALVTSLTTGENPLQVYSTMIYGAVGTPRKIWILGQNIALLLCPRSGCASGTSAARVRCSRARLPPRHA